MDRFTSEFGMESGGSSPLWSPGNSACNTAIAAPQIGRSINRSARSRATSIHCNASTFVLPSLHNPARSKLLLESHNVSQRCVNSTVHQRRHQRPLDYMVKPHGQLVLVSSTPYNASTPSLSTWWSSTALQDPQGVRENLSRRGLPA